MMRSDVARVYVIQILAAIERVASEFDRAVERWSSSEPGSDAERHWLALFTAKAEEHERLAVRLQRARAEQHGQRWLRSVRR